MAQIPTQLRVKDSVLSQAWTQLANIINNLVVQVFQKPNPGDAPIWDGEKWVPAPAGGSGVTSVGLTAPTEFSVAGSPITTAGVIAITKANEAANTVWAGPTGGAPVAPTFRKLTLPDLAPIPVGFILSNLTVGSDVAPHRQANFAGTLGKVSIWTRKVLTSDLVFRVYIDGNNVLGGTSSFTFPHTTPLDTNVDFTSFLFTTITTTSKFSLEVVSSDGQTDYAGIVIIQLSWS